MDFPLTVSEVARRTGLAARTLRCYERAGPPAGRSTVRGWPFSSSAT